LGRGKETRKIPDSAKDEKFNIKETTKTINLCIL